jgi:glycosyltransferase involved in cell wall biosynthesis
LISITAAIPAYNAEKYLRSAIESVMNQSLPCSECLVIDDGSTDGTYELASSFEGVRCLRQDNVGNAGARNRAIDEASSDLIAFLDADDVWLPNKLEKQISLFVENPELAMVYSSVQVVDESLNPLEILRAARGDVALRNTLFVEKPYMTGIGSTAVAWVEAARQVKFDTRLSASADWAFGCLMALRRPVDGIEEPLALYRQHGSTQVHHNLASVEHDMRLIWTELFDGNALPPELRTGRRRARANLDLSLAASSYKQGNVRGFLRHLAQAGLQRPDRVASAFWRRYFGP